MAAIRSACVVLLASASSASGQFSTFVFEMARDTTKELRRFMCVDITVSHADSVLEDIVKVGEFHNSVHALQVINRAFC